jgi:predicted nucleic acid-binding protein
VIARRLAGADARHARAVLDEEWSEIDVVEPDDDLIARAARVIDAHRLGTLDALHLAAALELGDPGLVIATWDADLARAARAEGLATAP